MVLQTNPNATTFAASNHKLKRDKMKWLYLKKLERKILTIESSLHEAERCYRH
jgi:uncharacterized protein YbcC (UPF0753/DUF2309 family)